jgi:glycosyltransferase involved in cell wall biosynthesis
LSRITILHVIDSLDAGGAERVAVNLANAIPRDRFQVSLCTSRRDGPLEAFLAPDVERLRLNRKHRFDIRALLKFVGYIRRRKINIIHAHSSSLFMAVIAAMFCPCSEIIWHDHYGRYAIKERPKSIYSIFARRLAGVIAVNMPLAEWSVQKLHLPENNVWYIPNGVENVTSKGKLHLAGQQGSRLVCVANLRPEKDHTNLIVALSLVKLKWPDVHLMIVGNSGNQKYVSHIQEKIRRFDLSKNVTLMGQCSNVPDILNSCDIGVLSSASEGLPLALLEYGMAGLPVVSTRVGQCSEVLEDGKVGILVPSRSPEQLAEGLLKLLYSPDLRGHLGNQLKARIQEHYSLKSMVKKVVNVYNNVLSSTPIFSESNEC